jgi:hypothetical protein
MKFQVKDEFAGRAAKCPACKQPLVVPQPSRTQPLAAGQIGSESSLDQSGVDGGITLEEGRAVSDRSPHKSLRELLANRPKNSGRYVLDCEIARGGMGAVLRVVDGDLRREVAVKYLLDEKDPRKKARFIEEAQIHGQLPLTTLDLRGCGQVRDLTPLVGMPLNSLSLGGCGQVRDLTPLTWLSLDGCPADPAPVRGIKTLKTITGKPAEEFWREYDAGKQGKK